MTLLRNLRRRITKRFGLSRKRHDPPLPRYSGPALIGKAITSPPKPEGPGWIGRRIRPALGTSRL